MTENKDTILKPEDVLLMQSLHYYSCEFPGDTYKGIPVEIVREGIKGLDMFLRIASWSQDGKDPYGRPNESFDEVNKHGELTMDIPF